MKILLQKIERKNIMRNDPVYLSQELTWKTSLGVLSVDGNLYPHIIHSKR